MTDLLKELIHYICWKVQDPSKLGATKLNKTLWFSDTIAYRATGRSITNTVYVKRQFGPVPKRVLPVLSELQNEGKIVVRERPYFSYILREFIAIQPASVNIFSAQELEIIDTVLTQICDAHSASSISEITHDDIWKAAEDGEEIPLFAVMGSLSGVITDEDKAWANAVVSKSLSR